MMTCYVLSGVYWKAHLGVFMELRPHEDRSWDMTKLGRTNKVARMLSIWCDAPDGSMALGQVNVQGRRHKNNIVASMCVVRVTSL